MPDSSPPTIRGSQQRSRPFIAPVLAVAVVVALTLLLNLRVSLQANPGQDDPLTVATTEYTGQETYTRTVSYLGLVVAGRRANLGFETPGLLADGPLRPGTAVEAGDVIATLDTRALDSRRRATAADLQQAQAQYSLAQLKAQRQEKLIATGAVSRDLYDETRLRAQALSSQVEAMSARLTTLEIELDKSRLVAPYTGVVADRYVQHGSVVAAGTPVVRLLESAVRESHIGVSAERAKTLVTGKMYPLRIRDREFEAELLSVRPDIDPVTRTTTAVFTLPANMEVLEGEPVTLELNETISQSGGWLPISALLEGSRGVWTVLRLEPVDGYWQTVKEAVEVLETRGDKVFVRGTLPFGSRVIASGVHRISPGTVVSVQEGS